MPGLIFQLRLSLSVVDSAAISVSNQENPIVHGISGRGEMDVVETSRGFISEDQDQIAPDYI
jgi:hypothetical protein